MGDETLLREIGTRINSKRKERGITQEQLAEKMDVSVQMISNLELGKKAIRPENLIKLCNALDVSADYILRGNRAEWEIEDLAKRYSRLDANKQDLIDKLIDSWTD